MTTPGANSTDTNFVAGSWLGGITGTKWSANELEGALDAIWIGLKKDGTLSGRKVNGETAGNYIEVNETQGTWQAGAAGEWVEVNPNLASGDLTTNMLNLGAAANIPISEVYASTLTGGGSFAAGGTLYNATMNLNLYSMDPGVADGIWAAIFNGNFAGTTGNSWTLNLSTTNANAALTGTQWNNGQWQATVDGNTTGATPTTFTGQAAGTYDTGVSTFTGTGTGTYTH
jgi:hypothetical protein